jgi:hypothetical protein
MRTAVDRSPNDNADAPAAEYSPSGSNDSVQESCRALLAASTGKSNSRHADAIEQQACGSLNLKHPRGISMNARNSTVFATMFVAAVSLSTASAAGNEPNDQAWQQRVVNHGPDMPVPLANWDNEPQAFIASLRQARKGTTKAATDIATVYRPISVCRLIDTRGLSAAIAIPGPLSPNSTTNINSAGFCGIPNNGLVAGLSVSFHVLNLTVNNGGFISFLQQGAPVTGVNAVFNPGASWTAATANISIPNDSGNFAIYIAASSVQVIVDVNGYYQDLGDLDVGSQQLDIVGNTTGDLFELNNTTGTGSALSLDGSAGSAVTIYSGKFRVSGADTNNSNGPVFTHTVNTSPFGAGGTICGGFPAFTVLDHPYLNGNPSAVIFVQPNAGSGASAASAGPFELYYLLATSCTPAVGTARWSIHDKSGAAHLNGSKFSVMVVSP